MKEMNRTRITIKDEFLVLIKEGRVKKKNERQIDRVKEEKLKETSHKWS